MFEGWIGIVGILAFLGLVYAASADRRSIRWRQVAWGLGLQIAVAVLVLRIGAVRDVFRAFADGVRWTVSFSDRGAETLFGWLARTEIPVAAADSAAVVGVARVGASVLLQILPTLIFVSALMSVLYHFGILQRVVGAMAWLMERTMRVSGAEALAAASNVFLGMTEAPLLIRPYLADMTASELMAVMVAGFATISSSMMAVYARFGVGFDQMLVASIISAPAALYLTKIALPETGTPRTLGRVKVRFERETVNFIDAAAGGAATGLHLALNVGAMLLAFAAGLALIDASLGALGGWLDVPGGLSLGRILGWMFWPIAWLMGVPATEAGAVGRLLGIKIAVNEYFAYDALSRTALSERSRLIAAFALCGFANFGSIAIQIGGIGGLIPERRRDLARFGIRAMLLGALATIISGTLAGIIVP